jgi:hypothetical protein
MEHPDLDRRATLARLLAAGCAAVAPTIAGCERPSPQVADAPAAAPEPMPAPAREASPSAPATGKARKDQVDYQDQPKDDQKCSACLHFVAESNTCKVVEGTVSPLGWCRLWAALPPAAPASSTPGSTAPARMA